MMIASPKAVARRAPACSRRRRPRAAPRRVSTRPSSRCRSASRRRQFSTMMTAPSTMSPKSIAPRLIRLPLVRVCDHADRGEQHRERDGERRDERGAEVAEHEEEHDDDEQRALGEVRLDGADRRVDERRAVEHRLRADVGRQARGSPRPSSRRRRAATVRLFAPTSMSAVPTTTSSPSSRGAAGAELARRCRPSATSRTRIGVPLALGDDDVGDLVGLASRPAARTTYASPLCST